MPAVRRKRLFPPRVRDRPFLRRCSRRCARCHHPGDGVERGPEFPCERRAGFPFERRAGFPESIAPIAWRAKKLRSQSSHSGSSSALGRLCRRSVTAGRARRLPGTNHQGRALFLSATRHAGPSRRRRAVSHETDPRDCPLRWCAPCPVCVHRAGGPSDRNGPGAALAALVATIRPHDPAGSPPRTSSPARLHEWPTLLCRTSSASRCRPFPTGCADLFPQSVGLTIHGL